MNEIAVLIPTYKRAEKLPSFIYNFTHHSTNATLYFIITPDDLESQECLASLNQNYFIVDGEYVKAINYGFQNTEEPFVMCAADDVEFNFGWDNIMLAMMDDKKVNIVGGIDDWDISKSGVHISHPLIRRSYVEKQPYYPNIYNPDYVHYMCDLELVQRGLKEKCVRIKQKELISHRHPVVKTAFKDATYKRSEKNLKHDHQVYLAIKDEFEMFDLNAMYKGFAVPTKLNPDYKKILVSVIIPVFNASEYLKRTLESIFANTYYQFEVILIDDHSDFETRDFVRSIESPDVPIYKIMNDRHQWVNYNWYAGTLMAHGDYLAILNSDIVVSKGWDKYLVQHLKEATITCPWEHNDHYENYFALDPIFRKYVPNLIKGPAFMFKREDTMKLFPIPRSIKHWCGDNWISDQAEKLKGVKFVKEATIYHSITRSGATLDKDVYYKRIQKDVDEYEKLSGRNMDWLRRIAFKNINKDSKS